MSFDLKKILLVAWLVGATFVAQAVQAEAELDLEASNALVRCQTAFDEKAFKHAQGILFDGDLLCIYGAISSSAAQAIISRNQLMQVKTVVARSYGGDVSSWLAAAESFANGIDLLIVDGFCFSSCAIYLPPMAEKILAVPGSLLVWHGGPNRWNDARDYGAVSDQDLESYADLSQRTENFLESYGINPLILWVSRQPLSPRYARQLASMGLSDRTMAGYAFSPRRLKNCFGFLSVDDLWHPGGNKKVLRLSKEISQKYVVAESPKQIVQCSNLTE